MTTFFSYAVSFNNIFWQVDALKRGCGSGNVSNGRVKKSIYELFLSIIKKIIVHNFDCIKSRIPEEVV